MNYLDMYSNRLLLNGDSDRNRLIQFAKKDIKTNIANSPSLKTVKIDNSDVTNLTIVRTERDAVKRWSAMPNEVVELGSVILWNKMHWLVTTVDYDDDLYLSGNMEQCNRQIQWQNEKTGEIIKRWCIISKPYYSNLDVGEIITTSKREFIIKISKDSETSLIDIGKKLMLEVINSDPKVYDITSVDQQTSQFEDIDGGFYNWNLKQSQSDENKDNKEKGIADYNEDVNKQESIPDAELNLFGKIIFVGEPEIHISMSGKKKFTGYFYDKNNVEQNGIIGKWTLSTSNGQEKYYSKKVISNSIEIFVDKQVDVNTEFELTFSNSTDSCVCKQKVKVVV